MHGCHKTYSKVEQSILSFRKTSSQPNKSKSVHHKSVDYFNSIVFVLARRDQICVLWPIWMTLMARWHVQPSREQLLQYNSCKSIIFVANRFATP